MTDLARLHLDDADLAFLSACSTARPGATLADEVIHLASAFQLAGYRHVIATLWPISDSHTAGIADDLYAALESNGTAGTAAALHTVTRQPRDRCKGTPSVWASYIHTGP